MTTFWTIAAAVLIFGLMIGFHEFGHFFTAKLSGVQVNEFSIGMGPALWKKIFRGTQYSLRLLPIGGYVAMEGEESPESRPHGQDDAGGETDAADGEAEEDDGCPIPREQRTGRPFNEVRLWKRFIVIGAGALMNFVLGFLVLLIVVSMQDSIITRKIYSFGENAKCQQTGLQLDDEIVAVNGRTCYVANDIVYELSRTENYTANFTVRRGGSLVEVDNVQFDTVTEDGQTYMKLNFVVYGLKKTPLRVIREAWNFTRFYARYVISSLVDLARGRESINDLSGPVGIVSAIGQAASVDWETLLSFIAMLTINLGIVNLLPLPALDGGKLVFLAAEGIIRRPVSARLQDYVNLIGFVLLFGLMIFATFNDITRLLAG